MQSLGQACVIIVYQSFLRPFQKNISLSIVLFCYYLHMQIEAMSIILGSLFPLPHEPMPCVPGAGLVPLLMLTFLDRGAQETPLDHSFLFYPPETQHTAQCGKDLDYSEKSRSSCLILGLDSLEVKIGRPANSLNTSNYCHREHKVVSKTPLYFC